MEQTSGTSYPNVLIVDYLKKTKKANPELLMKAMGFISTGYQKIVTFQTPSGGFSWWGPNDTPQLWVTAYGLQQIIDTARVYEIDPNVISKAQQYLISQQDKDGAWKTTGKTHGVAIEGFRDPSLSMTSYVAWTLAESKYKGAELEKALAYIRGRIKDEKSAYVLALAACALFAANPKDEAAHEIMERLVPMAKTEGDRMSWDTDGQTMSFARHGGATVETTALATYAAMKSGRYPTVAQKGLNHLIHLRSSGGAWGSTQSTILALKCMVEAMGGKKPEGTIKVKVRCNDVAREIVIDPDQADVLQLVDFGAATRVGTNRLEVETQGEGTLMFQAVARHFLPWNEVKDEERPEDPISFKIEYDRTRLSKEDLLTANVTMRYGGQMSTYMVIVDLGIPPGFDVLSEAFEKMLEQGRITKFDITGRQVILYFGTINPKDEIKFSYQLRPRYPVKVLTPTSQAYEYYTPDSRSRAKPVEIEVTGK